MSEVFTNETGCIVTRSHITGDILCRWPGEECDCLMQRIDVRYREDDTPANDNDDRKGQ